MKIEIKKYDEELKCIDIFIDTTDIPDDLLHEIGRDMAADVWDDPVLADDYGISQITINTTRINAADDRARVISLLQKYLPTADILIDGDET